MPQVRIPSPLRAFTDEQSQVSVAASTVGNALQELTERYPQLRDHLFQGEDLRNFVNLFIGEEDVNFLQGLETPLGEEDELRILPSIAGGLEALAPAGGAAHAGRNRPLQPSSHPARSWYGGATAPEEQQRLAGRRWRFGQPPVPYTWPPLVSGASASLISTSWTRATYNARCCTARATSAR